MFANLNSQVYLTRRVIQGRFILLYVYTYRVLLATKTCDQVSKMGVRTISYQCECVLRT